MSVIKVESETKLDDLLDRVERGEEIDLVRGGVHIGTIRPAVTMAPEKRELIERVKLRREKIIQSGGGMSLNEIIEARDENRK